MTGALAGFAGFTRALRRAGVACGPQRVRAYLAALDHVDLARREDVYWAGRVSLCAEPDDLPRYDAAFAAWFGAWFGGGRPAGPTARSTRVSRVAALTGGTRRDGSTTTPGAAAGDAEVLRHRDIASLIAAERAHLRELPARLRPMPPRRRALRGRPARRGEVDTDRTLRAVLATGEPVRPARRRRATRPRKVVLLVDVSGSMEPYADALLRFAHVVARAVPVEAFTAGTRLTRVTRQLRHRDPERALDAAARAVPDFAGGTRLGEALRVFLDRWGRRGVARGAVVVIFSDGWERGDPALLGEQLRGLRRPAHRVLWVNPHAGKDGYLPVRSGIAAALPHLDRLLAGHSLDALRRLLEEIALA